MKVENIKEVKARFNRIVSELATEGSVIITKNGRACAELTPITKDTDLEVIALSQNKGFWSSTTRQLRGRQGSLDSTRRA